MNADDDRLTPPDIIAAAVRVMGSIDLDPASCEAANATVGARRYYDPASNGLQQEWEADTLWLNPPGGKSKRESSAAIWWRKLLSSYLSGSVKEAMFLAFSLNVFRTGQSDGHAPYRFPFVVFRERIRFPSLAGANADSPRYDSALVYLPKSDEYDDRSRNFYTEFCGYGAVRI